MHSYSLHEMELHTQIALTQGKETPIHTGYNTEDRSLGGSQVRPGCCEEENHGRPVHLENFLWFSVSNKSANG